MKQSPLPEKLQLPEGTDKLLLHACCAVCCSVLMESLSAAGINFTIFFYNPNIHPFEEYKRRKDEVIRYAQKKGLAFVDADYDTSAWFARIKGLEYEPERGERCGVCFDLRFERLALYAHEHGFNVLASSLGMSRWKDLDQINRCGEKAASRYEDMTFWGYHWRKKSAVERMHEITRLEKFYIQQYCGCIYSLREQR